MKQKKLMALMLAAAMAVTSMTVPGGVLEPETVYADTTYSASDITGVAYDSTTGTLSATVPSDAAEQLQYYLYGTGSGSSSWRSDGRTVVAKDGSTSTVSFKLPAGSYTSALLSFKGNESSDVKYSSALKVGYDAATDIGNTLRVLVNGETTLSNNYEFKYTGQPVITSVRVAKNGETNELKEGSEAAFTYSFKDSNGTTMYTKPTDEGTYALHIYPRSFNGSLVNHTGYGTYDFTFTIAKEQLDDAKVKELLNLNAGQLPLNWTFNYNGTDQSGTVKEVIGLSNDAKAAGYEIESITFKQVSVAGAEKTEELKDVGTHDVYVKVSNATSSGTANVGSVIIYPHATAVKDFEVAGGEFTYDGTAKAAVVTCSALLGESKVKLSYKKDSSDVTLPTDAGTYDVYVAYDGDDNCEALTATDTTVDLVINKKEVSPVVDATVVGTDAEGSIDVGLSSIKSEYGGFNLASVASNDYIDVSQDAESNLIFKLVSEGKAVEEPTDASITLTNVGLGTNYYATIKIPITIVPAGTQTANITLTEDTFTYDGEAQELKYNVSSGGTSEGNKTAADFNALSDKIMTETITKDGKEVEEIKDAGTYVVTTEFKCENSHTKVYGKLVKKVTVNPATMTDATKYFKLEKGNLTYDGKSDFIKEICALVTVSGAGIKKEDYDIDLSTETLEEGVRNAGDVTVKVKMLGGNYTTTDWLTLGTVYINKASANNLTITDDGKGNLTVKLGDLEISEGLTISYCAKGSTEILWVKPTAKGEYTAKIKMSNLNFTQGDVKEYSYKIGGSSSSSSTSSDSSKETSSTTTTASGTTVTSSEVKNADGTSTVEKKLENKTTGEAATVTVEKNASGKVTEVTAEVTEKSADGETTISATTVADIKEVAGTDDVAITTKTVDANGNVLREVSVNASDLTAGKKLKAVKVNKETGEETLVNASAYKVAADGSLSLDNLGNASYELVSIATEKALTKEVLKTVKVAKASATVAAGKKTTIKLSKKLNMDNVKKVTYRSTKKSVAAVSKYGKITAKKAGKATIKAKVVLNNGKYKTVSMKIKVKAKK